MANKMDDKTFARLQQLKALGLTDKVISIRLGISERTVRVYTRAARTGTKPYSTPAEEQLVSSGSDSEATE